MGKAVKASEIADLLGTSLNGPDCVITSVSSFTAPAPNTMIFVERSTGEVWERLSELSDALVLCPEDVGISLNCATVWTDQPRLMFIRAVNAFFADRVGQPFVPGIGHGSVVSSNANVGEGVSIGVNSYVGPGVTIGANAVILNNVSVTGRTRIGAGCFIKSGAVIGETGFGFSLDEAGVPLPMPHFGGVIIGDNVAIGANSTVETGIFDDTVIRDHVKIDDLVQVGHNVDIGSGTRIAAGTILCGAVRIEEECWIAPNVTVRERVKIGRGAVVGLAANVVKDVAKGVTVGGNPARHLSKTDFK